MIVTTTNEEPSRLLVLNEIRQITVSIAEPDTSIGVDDTSPESTDTQSTAQKSLSSPHPEVASGLTQRAVSIPVLVAFGACYSVLSESKARIDATQLSLLLLGSLRDSSLLLLTNRLLGQNLIDESCNVRHMPTSMVCAYLRSIIGSKRIERQYAPLHEQGGISYCRARSALFHRAKSFRVRIPPSGTRDWTATATGAGAAAAAAAILAGALAAFFPPFWISS